MLLELARWLVQYVHGFNVFNYLTLRMVLATLTALGISFIMGPFFIRKLIEYKVGQSVRNDGPQTHIVKSGTPTMGGGLILIAITVSTLFWAELNNRYIWILLATTCGFGIIGWIDDWRKIVHKNSEGLNAKQKFFLQSMLGLVVALLLTWGAKSPQETSLYLPFLKHIIIPLSSIGFITLSYFVIVGSSNAVNLTDGLDGLAIMPTVMIAAGLAIFSYAAGHLFFAKYLGIPYIAGAGELAIFSASIVGAGLGFLWFNAYPAEVFMGDVGALALGAALGAIAIIIRQEIVLLIMGGVFVVETLSVMLQVTYFRYTKYRYGTGRRIFLMAPLHHHYEQKGWKENQVVVRFWIITMILVLIGLSSLKIR